jgi:hypothetical protein
MPNTYKSTAVEIDLTGSVTIYTTPSLTTTIVKSLYLSKLIYFKCIYIDKEIHFQKELEFLFQKVKKDNTTWLLKKLI